MKPDSSKREPGTCATAGAETQICKTPQPRTGILRRGNPQSENKLRNNVIITIPRKHPNIFIVISWQKYMGNSMETNFESGWEGVYVHGWEY